METHLKALKHANEKLKDINYNPIIDCIRAFAKKHDIKEHYDLSDAYKIKQQIENSVDESRKWIECVINDLSKP